MKIKYLPTATAIVAIFFGGVAYSNTFVYNPKTLTWYAYDSSGNLIKTGKGSGGSKWCSDVKRPCKTPVGTFTVYSKGSAYCKSGKYPVKKPGAPMPYCMFFHGGFAIHGSYELPNYNASHGCVRVHPTAAKWLSNSFINIGTKVVIMPYY